MTKDLLFEIGVEELPASYIKPALDQMKALTEDFLKESRLGFQGVESDGTPRRLVLWAKGVEEHQKDRRFEKVGPSKKAAFDDGGNPTKVAEGFAKSAGIPVKNLKIVETEKGEYVSAQVHEAGKPAAQLLESWLPDLTKRLAFPKSMRWGDGETPRFARPINWLCALFGNKALKLELAPLVSGVSTRGHRFLAPKEIKLKSAADYAKAMKKGHVMVAYQERFNKIEQLLQKAAAPIGKLVEDEELISINANLVEMPGVVVGDFDKKYLNLPDAVVIKVLREHQRNFAARDKKGGLAPNFLVVTNGTAKNLKGVKAGNEAVVRARLEDAKFFYEEDQKTGLADKLDMLKDVTWQEGLGSLYDKAKRMESLASWIAARLAPGEEETAGRAALLSKVDLVTLMVGEKEFTSLQGTMGKLYAAASGEKEEVAAAIEEHYRPRFAGDDPPSGPAGVCAALADKLDTLVGLFGIGLIPTGSQDPYALRRQASGVVAILSAQDQDLSLNELLSQAMRGYEGQLKSDSNELTAKLADFFRQRLEQALADQGHGHDLVGAVLSRRSDLVKEANQRAAALSKLRRRDDFDAVTQAFSRVTNILAKLEKPGPVDPALLAEGAERNLHERFLALRPVVERHCQAGEFEEAFGKLADLRGPVDAFFDGVMVMAEDPALRQNRLSFLHQVAQTIHLVADFSKLVKKG